MYNKNNLNSFIGIFLLILLSFGIVGGCGGGDSNREMNPDNSSTSGDDGDTGEGDATDTTGPAPDDDDDDSGTPETGTGEIRGSVVSSTGIPLNGVHVRAVNIDDTDIQISSFSGLDTNLALVDGAFSIQNVPPGTYRVLIEKMDDRNSVFDPDRYSDFVVAGTTLNFPDEYYNGADESSTDVTTEFVTIVVTNGTTVNGINFITND